MTTPVLDDVPVAAELGRKAAAAIERVVRAGAAVAGKVAFAIVLAVVFAVLFATALTVSFTLPAPLLITRVSALVAAVVAAVLVALVLAGLGQGADAAQSQGCGGDRRDDLVAVHVELPVFIEASAWLAGFDMSVGEASGVR
jgi:hypothetical protein